LNRPRGKCRKRREILVAPSEQIVQHGRRYLRGHALKYLFLGALVFSSKIFGQESIPVKFGAIWVAYHFEGTPKGGTITIQYLGKPKQASTITTHSSNSIEQIHDALKAAIDSFENTGFHSVTSTPEKVCIRNANKAMFLIEVNDPGLRLGPIADDLKEILKEIGKPELEADNAPPDQNQNLP
jgi:hypothetical protein